MILQIHVPAKSGDTGVALGQLDIARAFNRHRVELHEFKPAVDRHGRHKITAIFDSSRPEAEAVEAFPAVARSVGAALGVAEIVWERVEDDPGQ
jgi:hypothetical protein